eukprot:gene9534-biopygen8275
MCRVGSAVWHRAAPCAKGTAPGVPCGMPCGGGLATAPRHAGCRPSRTSSGCAGKFRFASVVVWQRRAGGRAGVPYVRLRQPYDIPTARRGSPSRYDLAPQPAPPPRALTATVPSPVGTCSTNY